MENLSEKESHILQKIEEALNNEHLMSNPDLNLYEFSKAINALVRIVSNTINKSYKKRFRALLNPYRISKAVHLIKSGQIKGLIKVGLASGFMSRPTLFLAFKYEIGVSPRDFAKLVAVKNNH